MSFSFRRFFRRSKPNPEEEAAWATIKEALDAANDLDLESMNSVEARRSLLAILENVPTPSPEIRAAPARGS